MNSTPIIALEKIGRLDLLRRLYGTVHVPRAVLEEVAAKDDAAGEGPTEWQAASIAAMEAYAHERTDDE